MKKSSNVKPIRVKAEAVAKQAFSVELKDVDIEEVIRQGLEEFTFQAGMLVVQQVMEREAENLTGSSWDGEEELSLGDADRLHLPGRAEDQRAEAACHAQSEGRQQAEGSRALHIQAIFAA